MHLSSPLASDLDAFVQEEIASGNYSTADAVVDAALRLLREREVRLKALRKEIDLGLEQIARGETIHIADEQSLRTFFDEIKAECRAEFNRLPQ